MEGELFVGEGMRCPGLRSSFLLYEFNDLWIFKGGEGI